MKKETAVFGAGCFWGVQFKFDEVEGVIETEVGYMGGDEDRYDNPNYKQVCSDETGYVEVVRVVFDPEIINYEEIVNKFFQIHNPTQLNRQGLDIGTQYKSVIFFFSLKQKKIAEKILKQKEKEIGKKIVTTIVKGGKFFRAEEYHQKYHVKHGGVC